MVQVEPCADVIFGPKKSAVGGQILFETTEKIRVLCSKFSDGLFYFLVIENCNKITTQQQWHRWRRRADQQKLAAAAPTNCRRRRRGWRTALVTGYLIASLKLT